MRVITLKEAHDLLSRCSALMVNGENLVFPMIEGLTGEESNAFLHLVSDATEFSFLELHNKWVEIDDDSLLLLLPDRQRVRLVPLFPYNFESIPVDIH